MRGHYTGMREDVFIGLLGINRLNSDYTMFRSDSGRLEVKECVNYSLNNLLRARMRPGQVILHAGAKNVWASGAYCFFTQDGCLYRMNPAGVKFLIDDAVDETSVNYCLVGKQVLISMSDKKLRIDDSVASYWIGVDPKKNAADTRQYFFPVADNGPMVYHAGHLFFAIGNFVYESLLFNANAFERSRRLQFNETVQGMVSVSGGIYFILETQVIFMAGANCSDFSEGKVLAAAPLCAQELLLRGELVPNINVKGICALFITDQGVFLGDEAGRMHSLTEMRLGPIDADEAHGVLVGNNLVFSTFKSGLFLETLDLSIGANVLSTYDGMTVQGGAVFKNTPYIIAPAGLTALSGDKDFGLPIKTKLVTGHIDYGASSTKAPRYGQLSGSFSGQLTVTCESDSGEVLSQVVDAGVTGIVRFGLSRELKGFYHVFTIENVDGAQAELHRLEVALVPGARPRG